MKLHTFRDGKGELHIVYRRHSALETFKLFHADRKRVFAQGIGRKFPYDGCGTGGMNNWTRTDYI